MLVTCISNIFSWMSSAFMFLKYDVSFPITSLGGTTFYVSLYDILIFLLVFYLLFKYILFRH